MDIKVSEMTPIAVPESAKTPRTDISKEFEFTLKRLGNEGLRERLIELISGISEQGKKIADHMDIRDMRQYRTLIGEFINEVVTNAHHFSRENFLDRRGRHRVYGIVKLVNKELDDLAQELLKEEKSHIAILDRTGQIDGLLLDMLV